MKSKVGFQKLKAQRLVNLAIFLLTQKENKNWKI